MKSIRILAPVRAFSVMSRTGQSELNALRQYRSRVNELLANPENNTSPNLNTLHSRLELPKNFPLSLLSKCLICRSAKVPNNDNHGLNILGKNILTLAVVTELTKKYPRLPAAVLNGAVAAFISDSTLYKVGKSWGIEVEDKNLMERYASKEEANTILGKLLYFSENRNTLVNFTDINAMAMAVRSIIGALYTIDKNANLPNKFIMDHILSRKLDVKRLFEFEQPTRELATLCRRENLERPVSKLLAENGRFSKSPLFIVGVFSGEEKLGEGFGSSLKEAKARAATDALLKWYCYEPVQAQQPTVLDKGEIIV